MGGDQRQTHPFRHDASQGATFEGELSEDGRAIDGTFFSPLGQDFPFALERTGPPIVVAAPRSPAIPEPLAGTWRGIMDAGGRIVTLILTMRNHGDGTAAGSIIAVEQGAVPVPLAIRVDGDEVTLEIPAVSSKFVGRMADSGRTLTGTYQEPSGELQLTFEREAP